MSVYFPPSIPGTRKKTKCQCPKCGRIHIRSIYWTGKGMPKRYCNKCRRYLDLVSSAPESDFSEKKILDLFGSEEKLSEMEELPVSIEFAS
jgi:hypothetical protein